MPGASYQKPEGQRVNRSAQRLGWTTLPGAGRPGAAPPLPPWREWNDHTAAWWANLWASPQATQWEQDGSTLWVLAMLYDDIFVGTVDASRLSAEIRQHEDRHGLNPKALVQLRWRIADDTVAPDIDRQPSISPIRPMVRMV